MVFGLVGLCADKASVTITTGWRRPCVSGCLRSGEGAPAASLCAHTEGRKPFASSTGSEAGIRVEILPRFCRARLLRKLQQEASHRLCQLSGS